MFGGKKLYLACIEQIVNYQHAAADLAVWCLAVPVLW